MAQMNGKGVHNSPGRPGGYQGEMLNRNAGTNLGTVIAVEWPRNS